MNPQGYYGNANAWMSRSGVILDPSMISVAPSLSDQLPAAGHMPFLTGTTGGPVDGIPPLNMMDNTGITLSCDNSGMLNQSDSGLSESSPLNTARNSNNPLLNVDISCSNFSRAINFAALSDGSHGSQNGDDTIIQDDASFAHLDAGSVALDNGSGQMALVSDEQLTVMGDSNVSDVSQHLMDVSEQTRAREQARLLSRFQELRAWQLNQQELLMKQQQLQMSQLHAEQQRIQDMLVQQRQQQWGSDSAQDYEKKSMSSPRKTTSRPSNAKLSPNPGSFNPPPMLGQTLPTRSSTPLETAIPVTPQQLGYTLGSDLSNTMTMVPKAQPTHHHGPQNAQIDVMSLEELDRLKQTSTSGKTRNGYQDMLQGLSSNSSEAQMQNVPSMVRVNGHLGLNNNTVQHLTSNKCVINAQSGNAPSHFAQPNYAMDNAHLLSTSTQVSKVERNSTDNKQMQLNDDRDEKFDTYESQIGSCSDEQEDINSEEFEDSDQETSDSHQPEFNMPLPGSRGTTDMAQGFIPDAQRTRNNQHHVSRVNDESSSCEGSDDSDDEQCLTPPAQRPSTTDFDEIPIGGQKKSFEQLLEEELSKEQQRHQSSNTLNSSIQNNGKFLKKGQGISRFYNAPTKKPKRTRTKSSNAQKTTKNQSIGTGDKKSQPPRQTVSSKPAQNVKRKNSKSANTKTNKDSIGQKHGTLKAVKTSEQYNPKKTTEDHTKQQSCTDTRVQTLQSSNKLGSEPLNIDNANDSDGSSVAEQTLGETSFQQRMSSLAKYEVVEKKELDEFEYLEHYADDNVSFLSNVSAINSALVNKKVPLKPLHSTSDLHQVKPDVDMLPRGQLHEDQENTDVDIGDLSSDDNDADVTLGATNVADLEDNIHLHDHDLLNERGRGSTSPLKHLEQVQQFSDCEVLDRGDGNKIEEHDDLKFPTHKPPLHLPLQSNNRPQTSTTKPSHSNGASQGTMSGAKMPIYSSEFCISSSDDSNIADVISGEKFAQKQRKVACLPKRLEFEDTETWSDSNVEPSDEENDYDFCDIKKNSALTKQSKVSESVSQPVTNTSDKQQAPETPPTSKLVTKLFPKLKPQHQPQVDTNVVEKTIVAPVASSDGVQSKQLRDKLRELENEIEKFRIENGKLNALRTERETSLKHLQTEMAEFEKQKTEELQRLKDFRTDELKKIKNERRLFDRYQKSIRSMPDKKDREEIESLKSQLHTIQSDIKLKEGRWQSSTSRLRDRVEHLETENAELRQELSMLEKRRLDEWQKQANQKKTTTSSLCSSCTASQDLNKQKAEVQLTSNPSSSSAAGNSYENNGELSGSTDAVRSNASTSSPRKPLSAVAPVSTVNNDAPVTIPRKQASMSNVIDSMADLSDENYEEIQHTDGKIEKIYTSNAREILFANGTRKQISADGNSIVVTFFNGDKKQIMPDQRVMYFYSDTQTTHTTYPDGLEVLHFPNNQIEKHYPDGTKEITFSDQTIKYLFPNGAEESIFTDGTVIRIDVAGDKTLEFPNGQREIHTQQYKRREYPDGTVKTVYPDGKQETRYSSGRLRVKDQHGNVIVDERVN